jgi:two-component system phosphate regulon sensor histidine kinase PhoR
LIGNAIKFTPAGGKITVGMDTTPSYTELSVSDTGRGIPKEDLPSLFERFTRVPETEGDTQGTGLGLMIVREIVEAHGGVAGVDSTLGEGSRFWFRLPRLLSADSAA